MNREVSGFRELQQTLSDFGIRSGRQLVTLRYKETDIPFEIALEEIAGFSPPKEKAAGGGESSKGVEGEKKEADEELMKFDAPEDSAKQGDTGGNKVMEVDKPMEGSVDTLETEGGPSESSGSNKPVVSVFRPSQSDTLAATQSKDSWSPF